MKSARRPWIRGGLLGLVPFLLPFVWVLDVESCGDAPKEETLTGLALARRIPAEDWLVVVPVLLVVALTPFIAAALRQPVLRLVAHLVGLLGTVVCMYGGWVTLFFTIFSTRVVKAPGWVMVGLGAGLGVDAVMRVVWSVQEWWSARRAAKAAAEGPS
jgi:hypothetical protein